MVGMDGWMNGVLGHFFALSRLNWAGDNMGEVMPARTSPTLHPPSPPTVHQLLRLAL